MKHRLLFAVLCLFLSLWGQGVYAQKKSVILKYTGFTVQYNPNNRQPDWAEYTLTAEHVEMSNNTPKVSRYFMPDPNLSLPQATPADYSKSGWVRGHMARRQDMKWSEQAIKESDYFTNICPQNDVMNNGVWHQIENLVRRGATQYDSVHVICGPIFTDHSNGYIGPNRLPVPDYFFKTLLVKDGSGYHAIAFLCPNSEKPLAMKDAACTVDKVESMSKIDVYSYLPDKTEMTVESQIDLKKWGIR
ncbi:MAG: DNA/RNA non-specific endonuclease [Bacteroidales bacterium]|nr:DNA/RNA non-specific endonuclease [Bacteroidales bacterium]